MKYIKTFESHRGSKNTETVNEEFLGAIGKFFGNMFKKAKERINKTKGGNEVEAIYQKYLDLISKEFAKTAKVELNLAAAARENEGTGAVPKKKTESLDIENSDMINEAEETDEVPLVGDAATPEVDAKTAVAQLKAKKTVLDQIIKKLKDMALKEMDTVLKKYGGAAANPQLEIIITAKKDQFDLDFMNAQISWLEKAGDKTESINISKQRDVIAKKIEADYKDFDSKKAIQYKEGDNVIYLLKDKKKEDYKADKKPEEQTDVVGVHKISKIEGDKFTLLDKDGNPTIVKTGAEILGKTEEYKVDDNVIYLLKDKNKEDYDPKKKPEEQKDVVGVHKISKITGDDFVLLDKDDKPTINKKRDRIIGKAEETKESD